MTRRSEQFFTETGNLGVEGKISTFGWLTSFDVLLQMQPHLMDIPISREPVVITPWFTKFAECFFAGVGVVNGLFMLSAILLRALLLREPGRLVSILFLGQFVVGLAAGFGFSFSWHHRERSGRISSELLHSRLRGLIRYWLAF